LLDGLGFRREERLGRPARARDPLRIIAAIVVPWLSKGCPDCFLFRFAPGRIISH
jgi:hypothetical protein